MARSFDEIYDHHGGPIFAYLSRLTGDAWVAEELCQETFLRYLANRPSPERLNGSLGPWLYRVATNLAIDRLRRLTRGRKTNAVPVRPTSGNGSSPDGRDLEARLRAEIGRLPPDLRAAFLLRAHHGLPYRTVAQALGVSERAAKDRFRRGRDLLRGRLSHLIEEHSE